MNTNVSVKTRIAPSPTGDWHLGNARTALFTYLFARRNNGEFLVRVEDTDQARLVPGADTRLFEVLDWLGLFSDPWPTGDRVFYQSRNLDRYRAVAEQLVAEGKAYYCFATPEELEAMRHAQIAAKQPPRYDGRYRNLPLEEAKKRVARGDRYVIRQKMPQSGTLTVPDLIHGEVTFDYALLDDHVLIKSDGFPTYHLAHVVDDHDAAITHVIRGDEWLPSLPRHVALWQALGWNMPSYAHVPVILGPDKGKLAKRHGAKPVMEYREWGYIPEGILNFLLLLGWSSGTEKEIYTKDEMIQEFSLERVHSSPAIFNQERLDWFNAQHLRRLPLDDLEERLLTFWAAKEQVWQERYQANPQKFRAVVALTQDRLVTLADFPSVASLFYHAPHDYLPDLLVPKKQTAAQINEILQLAVDVIAREGDWREENLEAALRGLASAQNIKAGDILWPVRAALTGLPASPGAFEVLAVLGKDESLNRLQYALTRLS